METWQLRTSSSNQGLLYLFNFLIFIDIYTKTAFGKIVVSCIEMCDPA